MKTIVRMMLLAAAILAAVSAVADGPADSGHDALIAEIRARGVDPESIVIPFEPSAEMRSWVHDRLKTSGEQERHLNLLLQAVLHRDSGDMAYQRGYTATAQEVWRSNKANCLSFTHLYVGLAREMGIPVYYLRVSDLQQFEKDGDLVVASEHVTAAWGPPGKRRILDFSDREVGTYREIEQISDITAIALHYSNLGAKKVMEGRLDEAEKLLRTSVALDPKLADGWVNLGVALNRRGDKDGAEASFMNALEANPQLVPALSNLAALLDRQGRSAEARGVLALAARRGNHDPFSYLALGDLALREGNLSDAARFFERARRLKPKHAEPLAAMGLWALAAGKRDDAERWYLRAVTIDPNDRRAEELGKLLHGG